MQSENLIAKALLKVGAIGFSFDQPITFVSGILAPVYVDNRRLPYYPDQWQLILNAMKTTMEQLPNQTEVIAGIETAGIPHSSALGLLTRTPSVFIRKKPKDHGTRSRIEGGDVKGKRVLLIEDMATTGGSSLRGVEALVEAGAAVTDCLVITSYGFPECQVAFDKAKVKLHLLCPFKRILKEALNQQIINQKQMQIVNNWMLNPREWRGL